MREFVTAAKKEVAQVTDRPDVVQFKMKRDPEDEGTEITAYRPDEAQFTVFIAAIGMGSTGTDGIAGIVNFLLSVVDQSSKSYLTSRLLDREDPFSITDLQEIMEYLIEEWSGRPSESSSDSAPSQQTGGRKSTQPMSESTSSELVSTGS